MDSDGSNIEVLGFFIGPTGIAIQDDGKIIVVENQNHAIRRMNADGSNIETLGSGFLTPYHASILENGDILIADTGNNAVKLMSSDGVNVQSLGSGLNAPYSVIPYTNNSLLIAETGNHAIKTLNQGEISNRVAVTVSINTLSLNDYNLNDLQLIPNPASTDIKIQHLNDNNSFAIFDIQGRKVSEGQINSQETIDISKLNSGPYLLYIKEKNLSLKFIKQ
jgi:mannose/fructose/N-acetylgalactosamine-specific phosphotransferase system component IIB